MRIRDLRRVITTIILTAPLAAGCVTGSCPDPAPIVTERVLIDMPDAQLMTLLASCTSPVPTRLRTPSASVITREIRTPVCVVSK